MFLFFGLAAVYIARDYEMGSAGRMGPAYFPTMLGWLLSAIGLGCVVRSLISFGEAVEKVAFKNLLLILISVLLFAALVRSAGLAFAVPVLILVSAYASRKFTWKASVALAVGATVFSILLFVKGLGVPMPIIGPLFGV